MKKINKFSFGGFSGFFILIFLIAVDEVASVLCGGNLGSFLWTTFHFILNPIFCFVYIIMTIVKGIHIKESKEKYFYPLLILLALGYLYIAFSGSIFWVKTFGIKF
jgi:hypothetical protein